MARITPAQKRAVLRALARKAAQAAPAPKSAHMVCDPRCDEPIVARSYPVGPPEETKEESGRVPDAEAQGCLTTALHFAPPPSGRLLVKRGGKSITRSIPKPTVVIDTREQAPFEFKNLGNWIGGTTTRTLDAGDYSVVGMESLLRLERKSLSDLITTLMQNRARFFKECKSLARFRYVALVVEATYEDVKAFYDNDLCTQAHPNAVSGSLDALEARFGIPVIYTSRHRPLAEEKAASWLSKHYTYWHLEEIGLGRVLQSGDL